MFHDDISFLVEETFKDLQRANQVNQTTNIDDIIFAHTPKLDDHQSNFIAPEEVPGVLYYVQKNASTFVVRVLPSDNLALDYKKIVDSPEDYPSLRLLLDESEDIESKLQFFEIMTKVVLAVNRFQSLQHLIGTMMTHMPKAKTFQGR